MLFLNTKTGEFGLTLFDVRQAIPNASIPDTVDSIDEYVSYKEVQPPYVDHTKDAVEAAPEDRVQRWTIVDASPEEIAQRLQSRSDAVRYERDAKLGACDWTQLPDTNLSAEDQALWRQYRKALRDVTSQTGFPWNIVWPVAPTHNDEEPTPEENDPATAI